MVTVIGGTFSALKHRNYRYYWIGQCISAMGTTMQSAALAWLVYTMTGSAMLLATLALFQFGPLVLLALPAGVLVDRWPKRRVIIITQSVFLLQALALSLLAFSGRATYQLILPLASIYGIAQAFDGPCRRAFMMDLVGKPDLMNAVSLNSAVFSLARIVGPSVAGIVMARLGGGWAFLFNAVSYLAVIIGLLLINVNGEPSVQRMQRHMGAEVLEGLRSIWQNSTLRVTMALALVIMIFGLNENIIVPVFADRVLHGGVEAYGVLMSAMGFGVLIGAVVGAVVSRKATSGRLIVVNGLAIGLVQVILSLTGVFSVSAALLVVLGAVSVLFANAAAATVQANADARLRGRVMSVYVLVEMGTLPLGNAFAGAVTGPLGAQMGFFVGGSVSVVVFLAVMITQRNIIRQHLFASSRVSAPASH